MKLAKWAGAALAGAMMMAAPNAGAVVVLDQLSQMTQVPAFYDTSYSSFTGYVDPVLFGSSPYAGSYIATAQSITAGASGKLDHVDFSYAGSFTNIGLGSGILIISLIDGDYSAGARKTVGQSTFDFNSLATLPTSWDPNFLNFSFQTSSFNYHVKSGQIFSVLFETDPTMNGFVLFNEGLGISDFSGPTVTPVQTYLPHYTGGKLTYYADGVDVIDAQGVDADLTFATYVDTSAGVPEPATWSLLILGFGGIGAALRKQGRRRGKRAAALAA